MSDQIVPEEIVKVQVPLGGMGTDVLIYAENRDRIQMQRPSGELLRQIGGRPKAYFRAKWKDGRWRIGQRVGDQPW